MKDLILRALTFVSLMFVAVFLPGCGGAKNEINARMGEMISFLEVVKDKDGFMSMYFDPRAVNELKASGKFETVAATMSDEMVQSILFELKAAQKMTPKMSYGGQVATYRFDGLPDLAFVKVDGKWYIFHEKK